MPVGNIIQAFLLLQILFMYYVLSIHESNSHAPHCRWSALAAIVSPKRGGGHCSYRANGSNTQFSVMVCGED